MDGVCDELDEVRAELEKLKEECLAKTKLIDNLRTAHNEHKIKLQEAVVQVEELAQELHVKSEEIPELKQLYEDLKLKVHEKDSLLRHLSSANEKLRADYGARFQKLETENKELLSTLDEATERIQVLELKIRTGNEEMEGLKRLLLNKQKKFLESDQKAMESKVVKQREDMILKLEEENRHVKEQLKWKNEQFAHLEEAHRKLQVQFRACKLDWTRERSALVEEISLLQTSLDSQIRISETLQTRLKMCNQALAHEESRRKILEVEVSELKSHFETAFSSSHESKTKSEHLTLKRDEEIANLRNLIGTKEIISREMEHRIAQLEQEKQGLNESLKESQTNNAELTLLLKKLEYKIQDLEQLQKNTSMNLQTQEDQQNYQIEKLTGVVDGYKSKLKGKNKELQELRNDLEGYNSLLEVQSEEISIVMMILKSEFAADYLKLSREMEHRIAQLEQDKQGLNESLKESQINNAELTLLLKKLENKIQDLEHLQKNTSMNLQKKGDQQSYQVEKLTGVVDGYKSKLMCKNKELQKLQNDLEGYDSLLEVQSEEISLVMMILKSEFAAAYLKLSSEKSEKELCNKESEEKVLLLKKQLEIKDNALHSIHQKLEQKNEEVTSLAERVKSYDCMKQQYSFMEEELQRHKKMVAESSENQNCLKKQVLNMESALKLAKRISEANNVEVELRKWKSMAEHLKVCLKETQETSKAENKCLQSSVKEQDEQICSLQQTIALLESRYAEKADALEALEVEKEHSVRSAEDDRSTIEKLEIEILCLTQNLNAREMESVHAQVDAEKAFEHEKKNLIHIIRDKDRMVEHLLERAKLAEQCCTNTFVCLVKNQIEIDVLGEALDNAGNLKNVEIAEKEKIETALKMEIENLHEKLEDREEYLLQKEQKAEQLEASLQENNCELEKVKYQSLFEQKHMEGLIKELELQKGALLEDIAKLSADRDYLLTQHDRLLEHIDEFSSKDIELMAKLESMSHNFEEEKGEELEFLADSGLNNSTSNIVKQFHVSVNGTGETIEQRFPLTELNL